MSSVTNLRIERYSASADERDTKACFLDFQEMGEPPRLMKKSLTERRVSQQEAQSVSQKAMRLNEGEVLKIRP